MPDWQPKFARWRHGGYYVTNVRYPSGGCGCVSNNFPDRLWRIMTHTDGPTFRSRDAAARAERDYAASLTESPQETQS